MEGEKAVACDPANQRLQDNMIFYWNKVPRAVVASISSSAQCRAAASYAHSARTIGAAFDTCVSGDEGVASQPPARARIYLSWAAHYGLTNQLYRQVCGTWQ